MINEPATEETNYYYWYKDFCDLLTEDIRKMIAPWDSPAAHLPAACNVRWYFDAAWETLDAADDWLQEHIDRFNPF